jgi:hypothetical protein
MTWEWQLRMFIKGTKLSLNFKDFNGGGVNVWKIKLIQSNWQLLPIKI